MPAMSFFGDAAKRVLGKVLLAVLFTTSGSTAQAAVVSLGVNFDDNGTGAGSGPNVDIGWKFSLSSAINVTQLGFWDQSANGLGESHSIAIWSASGLGDLASALVTGTVSSGTGNPLSPGSQFRMVDVAPTLLAAGDYVIAGRLPGIQVDAYKDGGFSNTDNLVYGSGVTFIEKRFAGGGAFARPDNTGAGAGLFGPNFAYTAAAVPEASSIALAGFGLAGLLGWSWRRKRSH